MGLEGSNGRHLANSSPLGQSLTRKNIFPSMVVKSDGNVVSGLVSPACVALPSPHQSAHTPPLPCCRPPQEPPPIVASLCPPRVPVRLSRRRSTVSLPRRQQTHAPRGRWLQGRAPPRWPWSANALHRGTLVGSCALRRPIRPSLVSSLPPLVRC